MLKIEKLTMYDNNLTPEEERIPCKADVAIKNKHFSGTGVFFRSGAGVNAAIGVAGTVDENVTGISKENITLTLSKTVTREFTVKNGDETVVASDLTVVAALDEDDNELTVAADAHTITLNEAAEADGVVELKLVVAVGGGMASDNNINDSQTMTLDAGDVSIDMCCRAVDGKDMKPNGTSFTIKGSKLHF